MDLVRSHTWNSSSKCLLYLMQRCFFPRTLHRNSCFSASANFGSHVVVVSLFFMAWSTLYYLLDILCSPKVHRLTPHAISLDDKELCGTWQLELVTLTKNPRGSPIPSVLAIQGYNKRRAIYKPGSRFVQYSESASTSILDFSVSRTVRKSFYYLQTTGAFCFSGLH